MENTNTIYSDSELLELKDKSWEFFRYNLSVIVKKCKPGRILDIGCGMGYFVECCRKFGIDCVGIEGSKQAIDEALARDQNLKIFQHDLNDLLPFDDNSFATVIMDQVIEHLTREKANQAIREIYRILEPGGSACILSPSKWNFGPQGRRHPKHINLYDPNELCQELKKAGFINIETINFPKLYFGTSKIGCDIMTVIFKLTKIKYLSANSNCIASK